MSGACFSWLRPSKREFPAPQQTHPAVLSRGLPTAAAPVHLSIAPVPPRRKAHKKDQVTEIARKKRRVANKNAARAIVGVSLEVINKRRAEKPEVRSQTGGGRCSRVGTVVGSCPVASRTAVWALHRVACRALSAARLACPFLQRACP